jgi:hypothetical protein
MSHRWSRRSFVTLTSGLSALGVSAFATRAWGQAAAPAPPYAVDGADVFPQLDPNLVREAVGVSHANLPRLRELVEKQPALARASWDWGSGDWEACIDAAAHVGNRPIAEFLLAHGARPTIFSAAMMGQLDVVKAFIAAQPGIQRNHGPHGLTLLSHARAGGPDAAAVVSYLTSLGDADIPAPTQPLDAADRDALVGKYVYGPGPRDYFIVDVRQDRIAIDRPGGAGRHNMMHSGNLVFFPVGVPSTKIMFARENGKVIQLTLADPNNTVIAKKV